MEVGCLNSGVACLQVGVVLAHAVHRQGDRREAGHALLGGEGEGRRRWKMEGEGKAREKKGLRM